MKLEELEITKYISEDILKKLPIKTYKKGEIILYLNDERMFYILEGEAEGVMFQDEKEQILPYIYSKDDLIGIYGKYTFDKFPWEIIATSDIKVIVFSKGDAEKYIYSNLRVRDYTVKKLFQVVERRLMGFYIQVHRGAKSHFAYLLWNNIENNKVSNRRYLRFHRMLGISEGMLYRIIREMIKEGVIEKKKDGIIILDEEKLKEYYE